MESLESWKNDALKGYGRWVVGKGKRETGDGGARVGDEVHGAVHGACPVGSRVNQCGRVG